MIDFLTEGATFKCLFSPLVKFTLKENVNRRVTHNGSLILTDSLTLKGSGKCIPHFINTLTVDECNCSLLRWLNSDSSTRIKGRDLLTRLSFNICIRALPKVPSPILITKSGVDGRLCKGLELSIPNPEIRALTQNLLSLAAADNPMSEAEIKSFAGALPTAAIFGSDFGSTKNDEDKKSEPTLKKDKPIEKNDVTGMNFRCAACSKDCSFRLNGKPEDHQAEAVKKDATKLRNNYWRALGKIAGLAINKKSLEEEAFCRQLLSAMSNPKFTDADRAYVASLVKRCEITREIHMEPWTYAAHHIIPGDAILKKLPKCYSVANLRIDPDNRVFDVNDAVNCIQLLRESSSKEHVLNRLENNFKDFYKNTLNDAIRNLFPTPDNIEQFDLMCAVENRLRLKIQWHDTHHGFTMNENTRLYRFKRAELNGALKDAIEKNFPGKELYSYDDKVMEQMMSIERAINLDDLCVKEVRDRIVRLIADIRRHLSNFAKDPRASYPYFVTKTNYFYAMKDDLPKG